MNCDVDEKGICADCGDEVTAVLCCDEIADFCYGRSGTQKHYFIGSPCCEAPVIKEELEEAC
jgi:hypothetical protein